MIRINTDALTLQVKCILAKLSMPQFVLMEIRPAPYLGIDNVWESLPSGNLHRNK